eukprot:CAMPEP_0118905986 /NCGR_PEP_ID=MMETSP1166-20130328/9721_1 /TAXON_ID=1104430 /ORGANISM="Chrysoreinhardia sp, Strain CCMP3193" /LENGTH=296 /DNA_ID=CAMNT_0006845257 /DNA_START=13 /DNA_END=903 /DNA_ORIENTATION=-
MRTVVSSLLLLLAGAVPGVVVGVLTSYDGAEALRALELSEAAYCISSKHERCLACPPGVEVTEVVTQRTSGGLAVVGYDDVDDSVFVAFRGSSNTRNWIENVKFVKTRPYDEDVAVERGFFLWYKDLNASGVYDAVKATARRKQTKNLKVTGHSAGGACATLFAFDYARGVYPDMTLLSTITFGSPRVGDVNFKTLFDSFHLRSFRVTHYHDVVPHMPFERSMHFEHVPTEVYYDELSTTAQVCDASGEDPACSLKCAPFHCTSVSDHLNYLNVSLGTDGCANAFAKYATPQAAVM